MNTTVDEEEVGNKRLVSQVDYDLSEEDGEAEKSSKKLKVKEEDNTIFDEVPPADELEDIVDEYVEQHTGGTGVTDSLLSINKGEAHEENSGVNAQYVPKGPSTAIEIAKNPETGKYKFPFISKEDSLTARSYLKHYGANKFLDTHLPEDLNSLYIYHLIKLLGFQIKDKQLLEAVQNVVESDIYPHGALLTKDVPPPDKTSETGENDQFDDPLEKRHAVRLIKDLQKAMNKVLSTRMKLAKFHTLDDFCAKLKEAKKVLVLTGAGISTSLGIPDFRSSEGFYSKIRHLGLDDPQDVFNYDIFIQDPSVFYNIAHMVLPPENIFSPLHSFIKLIEDKGKLLRNYTQNIDNLESYAGIQSEKLVQCHGSFATASCVTCHWKVPGEKIFQNIRNLELPLCPYCYHKRKEYFPTTPIPNSGSPANVVPPSPVYHMLKSYGVLKPDITFFGEALPSKFHRFIREDVLKCDLLICIGTSLKVAPVSEIVNMIPAGIPQVLINKDPVRHAEFDLSLLGLCDDVAALVARKCGWDVPHDRWPELKAMNIDCIEVDRGVYQVKPSQNVEEAATSEPISKE
ncbi:LAMI_0H19570g1_1 [Lachancea mirantina]|uniref:LAMI_0H19570g1_1 n=1 Tax=Lachancea mirantina TaxID=1230905 RepID=A0A1G4KJV7_9SACH|nr:LAMI_0H19570g1_1 [Lachancea mirantina]